MVGRGEPIADRVRIVLPQYGVGQRPMHALNAYTVANGRKREQGDAFRNEGNMKCDVILGAKEK